MERALVHGLAKFKLEQIKDPQDLIQLEKILDFVPNRGQKKINISQI